MAAISATMATLVRRQWTDSFIGGLACRPSISSLYRSLRRASVITLPTMPWLGQVRARDVIPSRLGPPTEMQSEGGRAGLVWRGLLADFTAGHWKVPISDVTIHRAKHILDRHRHNTICPGVLEVPRKRYVRGSNFATVKC